MDLPLVLQAKADECSLAMAEALLRKAVAEAFGQVPPRSAQRAARSAQRAARSAQRVARSA